MVRLPCSVFSWHAISAKDHVLGVTTVTKRSPHDICHLRKVTTAAALNGDRCCTMAANSAIVAQRLEVRWRLDILCLADLAGVFRRRTRQPSIFHRQVVCDPGGDVGFSDPLYLGLETGGSEA